MKTYNLIQSIKNAPNERDGAFFMLVNNLYLIENLIFEQS